MRRSRAARYFRRWSASQDTAERLRPENQYSTRGARPTLGRATSVTELDWCPTGVGRVSSGAWDPRSNSWGRRRRPSHTSPRVLGTRPFKRAWRAGDRLPSDLPCAPALRWSSGLGAEPVGRFRTAAATGGVIDARRAACGLPQCRLPVTRSGGRDEWNTSGIGSRGRRQGRCRTLESRQCRRRRGCASSPRARQARPGPARPQGERRTTPRAGSARVRLREDGPGRNGRDTDASVRLAQDGGPATTARAERR